MHACLCKWSTQQSLPCSLTLAVTPPHGVCGLHDAQLDKHSLPTAQ